MGGWQTTVGDGVTCPGRGRKHLGRTLKLKDLMVNPTRFHGRLQKPSQRGSYQQRLRWRLEQESHGLKFKRRQARFFFFPASFLILRVCISHLISHVNVGFFIFIRSSLNSFTASLSAASLSLQKKNPKKPTGTLHRKHPSSSVPPCSFLYSRLRHWTYWRRPLEAESCRAAPLDRSTAGYIWDGSSGPAGGPTEAPGTGRRSRNSLPERLQLSSLHSPSSSPRRLPPFVFAPPLSRCTLSYFLTICLQIPEVKCGILSFKKRTTANISTFLSSHCREK